MSKAFAVITLSRDLTNYIIPVTEHLTIYERMMQITGNDHEESSNAASWCELAAPEELYDFREGIITIKENRI